MPTDGLQLEQADLPWASERVQCASDLKKYVSDAKFKWLASAQLPITDTTAEMWHWGAEVSPPALLHLQGAPCSELVCDLEVRMAKSLQSSILQALLPQPVVTYRGVGRRRQTEDHFNSLVDAVSVGDTITAKGFWSASTDPWVATRFALPEYGANSYYPKSAMLSVVYRLETPLGKFVEMSTDYDGCDHTFRENEVLLPHGAEFVVVGRDVISRGRFEEQQTVLASLRYSGVADDDSKSLAVLDDSSIRCRSGVVETERHEAVREELEGWSVHHRDCGRAFGDMTTLL